MHFINKNTLAMALIALLISACNVFGDKKNDTVDDILQRKAANSSKQGCSKTC
jgi:hypothetical protein